MIKNNVGNIMVINSGNKLGAHITVFKDIADKEAFEELIHINSNHSRLSDESEIIKHSQFIPFGEIYKNKLQAILESGEPLTEEIKFRLEESVADVLKSNLFLLEKTPFEVSDFRIEE